MRRDRYQARTPATSRPPRSETPKNFISVSHVLLNAFFGLATTRAPKIDPSSRRGWATARNVRLPSEGVNSNETDLPSWIDFQSSCDVDRCRSWRSTE